MKDKFTICVLLYGDHPQLAERCLTSICDTIQEGHLNLRIGLNQVSQAVRDWVFSWMPHEDIWEAPTNIHKYPMMRQMFYGARPVETPYTMWFDDDSYLDGYQLVRQQNQPYWLSLVEQNMVNSDMIGSVYTIPFQGQQRAFVRDQSWYNGRDPEERKSMRFATGGWWTARTEVLREWDYPWEYLDHRGGDCMFGELMYQQGLRLNQFRDGVKINADDQGRESKAQRRGFDQPPLGVEYDPGVGNTLHRATSPVAAEPPQRRIIEL